MSNTLRRVIIATKKAPDAIGPYNQAVQVSGLKWHLHAVLSNQDPWQVNNTLYISGQIGFIPETMEVIKGGVVAETKQALTNMGGWTVWVRNVRKIANNSFRVHTYILKTE